MKVSELGEFGLIELLAKEVAGTGAQPGLAIGIGDDAAAWRSRPELELATTDILVEGIHFLKDTGWYELGWKALAANLSDIAAMGGVARYALVSLALTDDTEVDSVVSLYRGMADLARRFGVAVVGGDTVSSPIVVINIALLGNAVEDEAILRRSAARPGDLVAVTGYLGSSAGGLEVLKGGLRLDAQADAFLRDAHLKPWPRLAEGQALVRCGVRAGMDISDGLVADLGHIAGRSRVEAHIEVDRVPFHPLLKEAFGDDALGLALSGGEDYELLFTAPPGIVRQAKKALECPVTVIGEIVEGEAGEVRLEDEQGQAFDWAGKGWEHFISS